LALAVNDKDSYFCLSHSASSFRAGDFPAELALLGKGGDLEIIFDSGTTAHVLPTKTPMFNYRIKEGMVKLGDLGVELKIAGEGDTTFLPAVLHVPRMSYGLISIACFDNQGCMSIFNRRRCWVVGVDGSLLCSGTLRGNLYHLDDKYMKLLLDKGSGTDQDSSGDDFDVHFAALVKRLVSTRLGFNDIELLHQRWAHASEQSIKQAVRDGHVKDCDCDWDQIKKQRLRFCNKCWMGHMRAFDKSPISTKMWEILAKVGVDFKGPFPKRTPEGYIGYFLFADQASNFTKAYLVKSQRALLWCLKDFLNNVVTPTGHAWRLLQCDHAKSHEKRSVLDWLASNYIRIQYSAPYKHSQNGMVERDIGFVMDRARTVIAQYNTPPQYWGWAVLYAVYTINRTHVPKSTGKTPYEMVYKTVASVAHLVPFFAPGVYHLTKEERKGKSWENKAEPCRMLGYSEDGKGSYIVLNVRTGRIVKDRADCIFDESFHEVLKEHRKHPDSPLVYELFDKFEQNPAAGDKAVLPSSVHFPPKIIPVGKSDLTPDEDPGETDVETDSESYLTLFPNTVETDFDGDMLGIEQDCDDWMAAAAQLQDLPPLPPSPPSIEAALAGPDKELWRAAIKKELDTMERLKVMAPAEKQTGHGMKMKMILKTAYNNDFSIKYKARLVICGYSQIHGRDYDQTYSPTIAVLVILLVLHVAASLRLFGGTFDVTSAFLNATNDFENYGYLPKGLFGGRYVLRMKILQAMYGEKQAPKLWNDMLHKILLEMGYKRCPVSACLYFYHNGDYISILTIHVDDGLLFASHMELLHEFIKKIQQHLPKVTLTMPLCKYVGMEINYNREMQKVQLSQEIFADALLPDAPRVETIPMCPSINLRSEPPNTNNDSLLHTTGQLRYLCDRTRPDLLVATGEISKGGAESPSDAHLRTAMRTLRYAKVTAGRPLGLGCAPPLSLFCFSDASYHADGNSKSRLGGCLFLGESSGAFHTFSKSSSLVTQSSTHAELLALYETVNLTLHTRQVLEFIHLPQTAPTPIYCDSTPSIQLCTLLKMTHKTASINMRVNFIRQCLNDRQVSLHFVPTALNIADALTKPLAAEPFNAHTTKMMQGFGAQGLKGYFGGQVALVVDSISETECDEECSCCFDSRILYCRV
jgi:hypothetical protein